MATQAELSPRLYTRDGVHEVHVLVDDCNSKVVVGFDTREQAERAQRMLLAATYIETHAVSPNGA